jgi:hypothetical protein
MSKSSWALRVVLLGGLAVGCAADKPTLFISSSIRELTEGGAMKPSTGCETASSDDVENAEGALGDLESPRGDFVVRMEPRESAFVLRVLSVGEVLVRREYDRAFLASAKLDRFEVTTQGGRRFEFAYRGAEECEVVNLFEDNAPVMRPARLP